MLRKVAYCIIINLILLAAVLTLGEASLRLYQYHKYGMNILDGANSGFHVSDDKLGWRMNENINFETVEKDALNKRYHISFKTYKDGFKAFGNAQSANKKILFLGDSYTAALEVSNTKTYYGLIKSVAGDVEVFAYGGPGYATLQEFMILDECIDEIRPDYIVLQFCWNDFLENNYDLDPLRSIYNSGFRRPYLDENNVIIHKYASYGRVFFTLPEVIAGNLRILKYINRAVGQIYSRFNISEYEEIERSGTGHDGFRKSVETTKSILLMVKARAKGTPVYLFCIPYRQPYYDAIMNICRSANIVFMDDLGLKLKERENDSHLITRSADREHLNEEGHRVVSENLMLFFRGKGIVQSFSR